MHHKLFFLTPGILWESQKYQANITFSSPQNKNFSVISKRVVPCQIRYHLVVFLTTERSSLSVLKMSYIWYNKY